MTRRDMLAMMLAGGVVTATGIWMPGDKLISIPKKQVYVPTSSQPAMRGHDVKSFKWILYDGRDKDFAMVDKDTTINFGNHQWRKENA